MKFRWLFGVGSWVLGALFLGGATSWAASITRTATVASNTSGWTNWTTTRLGSSDNSLADTGTSASATGVLYGFDFSSIPVGSTIVGIEVMIEAKETNAAVDGYTQTSVSWNSGTNYSSTQRSPGSGEFTLSDANYTVGGPTDSWGRSWSLAEITSTFRVKIVATDASSTVGRHVTVDYVTVTIYYDEPVVDTVTLSEAVGQAGWMGRGETQRILGTAQVVFNSGAGVTISSVAVQASGYTADGNLTNVEVWVSSSGYIDANAIRLEETAKAFSSNVALFMQDVFISSTPLYFIARSDVSGSATEGTFDIALQVYSTANTANNPIAFTNATDVVAPPSGSPSSLNATASSNLLRVTLSWGAATGSDSYTIFRATHSGVTTTDYIVGMTSGTSHIDDYIPPAQQMYYKVLATNRAGSTLSSPANATSVNTSGLTTSNIYVRGGRPSNLGNGNMAYTETLSYPNTTSIDFSGNVYIADRNRTAIRLIPKKGGTYFGQSMMANCSYTIAGNGTNGYLADNVAATSTRINQPYGVSVDVGGNVYIADTNNNRIRFIPKNGGTYFGQSMTANYIYTIAGTGTAGYVADNVPATSTQINAPNGVNVDAAGNVYIGDTNNHRIRFIPKSGGSYFGQTMTANYIYTIAGTGTGGYVEDNVVATSTPINKPNGVSVDAGGNVYIADYQNHRIRFIPKGGGAYFGQTMMANSIYTIAGTGQAGYWDNRSATTAWIYCPSGVSVDSGGNVYIADNLNHRIRFVPKTGGTYFGQSMTANYIYTIAGNGSTGYLSDNVAPTSTRLDNPAGVSVDAGGNVYIADTDNYRIRFIPKSGGVYFGQMMTANYIYTITGIIPYIYIWQIMRSLRPRR
ncbi:MAG: hypothetical protein JNK54_03115 [Elusimicrobia bacterium]|nr:hypothetical protein [Elusimicrobiota bacterium]